MEKLANLQRLCDRFKSTVEASIVAETVCLIPKFDTLIYDQHSFDLPSILFQCVACCCDAQELEISPGGPET